MAEQTYAQLQCVKQGGPFETVQVPKPTKLGPDQVLVRQTVVALNAFEWKQRDFGIMVKSWPHVLGLEGAGIVDSVGDNVQNLQPGDEVMCWASGKAHGADWGGSYQEYTVLPAHYVAKKPRSISIEEASSLPICYNTAVCAIISLNIPLPFIKDTPTDGKAPRSVLVLGGGSNVGAGVIQLLRRAYPTMTILATSSIKHFERLEELGATRVFDYHAGSLVTDVKNGSPTGSGVDVVIDCVGAANNTQGFADVFDPEGERKLATVMTGSPAPELEDVSISMVNGFMLVGMTGGKNVVPTLTDLVDSGRYKVPFPPKVVGHGLDKIPEVMDMTKTASGEKLVVTL